MTAASEVMPITVSVKMMPLWCTVGIMGSMCELVSTTSTTESGSPPRSKCSIFCSAPLS